MLTLKQDPKDSQRNLVYQGAEHVGVIIFRGTTRTSDGKAHPHYNVISAATNRFVGSVPQALAIIDDADGDDGSRAVAAIAIR